MIIASKKRKENIAEYMLYMWQVEDIIRAYGLDIEKIKEHIIRPYCLDAAQEREMTEWYESLIDMMRREGVAEKGHLQLNRGMLNQLVQLHQALLADPEFAEYTAEFYRTLPYIVELRSKAGEHAVGEIETCFTALYGMLMMRMQKKEISEDTQRALEQITRFIALLSRNFHLDEADKLFKHSATLAQTPAPERTDTDTHGRVTLGDKPEKDSSQQTPEMGHQPGAPENRE